MSRLPHDSDAARRLSRARGTLLKLQQEATAPGAPDSVRERLIVARKEFQAEAYAIHSEGELTLRAMADVVGLSVERVRQFVALGRREALFSRVIAPGEVFARLWAMASAARCGVLYVRALPDEAEHTQVQDGKCLIRLSRLDRSMPPDARCEIHVEPDLVTQPEKDCILLAHQYGRHLSHLNRECARDRLDVERRLLHKPETITDTDAAIIIGDDEHAWSLGRKVLTKFGVTRWDSFEAEREKRLYDRRERLLFLCGLNAQRANRQLRLFTSDV